MKRLLEQDLSDALDRRLTDIVRDAEPMRVSPFGKRQIWVRLQATHRRDAPRRLRPLPAVPLPTVWALALLGGGAGAASLGYVWWNGAAPPASDRAVETDGPRPLPTPAQGSQANEEHEEPTVEPPPTAIDLAPPPSTVKSSSPGASRAKDPASSSARTLQATDGEDPTQVMAAIRAWRSERDGSKANGLLHEYLRNNPRGALAEDALALLIEVAAAQKDPRAARYAKRYLNAYPRGRFRELAERVVDTSR